MSAESNANQYEFDDHVVIIDHNTTHRPYNSREFIFRIRTTAKAGHCFKVYRVEIDLEELAGKSERHIAEILLRGPRRKSLLFTYREP
jgi:hypothetical protein